MSWAILKGLLPLNTKVAPRSAWVQKSLVSFVSFFSLCCFWHVIPACRHAWLPQLILFLLHKHITDHPFLSLSLSLSLSLCLSSSVSLSPCLSPHSFLSMSNNSKLLCPASVVFWMCSYLKNSIPLVSWFPFFCILINQTQTSATCFGEILLLYSHKKKKNVVLVILVCTLPKTLADSWSYYESLGVVFDAQLKNGSLKAFSKAFLSFKVSDMSTFCCAFVP